MKKLSLLLSVVLIISLVSACQPEKTYNLHVVTTSWSGWTADYEPDEEYYDYVISRKGTIKIDRFSFEVTDIKENSISIKTSESMSANGDGTIDLSSKKTKFTVKTGETLELITPTTDYGDIYIFTLSEIKK